MTVVGDRLRQELSLVMKALAISPGKAEAGASTLYPPPMHLIQRTSVVP